LIQNSILKTVTKLEKGLHLEDSPGVLFSRKYLLLVQFYVVLALAFFSIIPDSQYVVGTSGLLFLFGLFLLVYKSLISMLSENRIVFWAFLFFLLLSTDWMYFKQITFTTHFFDLGIFMQPLYSTLYGHQFFTVNASPDTLRSVITLNLTGPSSSLLLKSLTSPMLFLLLPFYAVYPNALTLFMLQGAAIGLPAFLLYRMVEDKGKALWISLLWLAYAPMYYALVFDFHTETFYPLFLFLVVYFMKRNTKLFYVSLLLFLSVNQAAPLLVFLFLPYIFWNTRKVRLVLLTALMAAAFILIAYASSGGVLQSSQGTPLILPSSVSGLLASLSSSLPDKLNYVLYLLAPLLFLPLLEPLTILPALGWLGYAFVKNYFPYTNIQFQYAMVVAGFLFLALIGASRRIDGRVIKIGLVVSLVVFAATWSSAGGQLATTDTPYGNPAYPKLNSILSQIPPTATVMASDDVFPHLANSMNTYFTPTFPPQWIVISKYDRNVGYQLPYINHYLAVANYTIIENDSILFVAELST